MIYIIGDSHVSVFSGTDKTHDGLRHIQPEFGTCYTLKDGQLKPKINKFEQRIPFFCPIKIGSHTAWNSFDKIPKIERVIDEYQITNYDYIFLSFGEIDIRNHIGFVCEKQNKNIEYGIKECVERYFKTILHLHTKYGNIGVYAPPASSVGWEMNFSNQYKDVRTRNKMTLIFNSLLKSLCDENLIIIKDVSKKMMLPDGTTNEKFIMDDIHLSQEAMTLIKEEFKDLIY